MQNNKVLLVSLSFILIFGYVVSIPAQMKGMESITAEELKFHLRFLAADEFQGRNTPSDELKIASKYIALMAEQYGLKPMMPDGSYLQKIPLNVSRISEAKSKIRITTDMSEQTFFFPQAFGIRGRNISEASISGEVEFLGLGVQAPEQNWDDYGELDLKGKIAVILDVQLPDDHILKPRENHNLFRRRTLLARQKGAVAVLTVVSREREKNFVENGYRFDNSDRSNILDTDTEYWARPPSSPLYGIEIRHELAAALLGVSKTDVNAMYETIMGGEHVKPKTLSGRMVDISIQLDRRKGATYNVVAYLEGKDPVLRNEYVLFGSHHDHIGAREGRIYNGADDNGSGTVAMLELAQAMVLERPKRSVIFVWHTGEEKGLWGAFYFVSHSPVPVENMSAELNMDMLCRNDPNSIYLIGSNKLSSELDASIHAMNDKFIHLNLDYKYEDPGHSDRFFFRSDQYPYIRYGIPGVWFFCGTTEDYHQETDSEDRVDYAKMEKVTKLVYLTAIHIGNMPEMLKLDVHPEITTRGKHNEKINWRQSMGR